MARQHNPSSVRAARRIWQANLIFGVETAVLDVLRTVGEGHVTDHLEEPNHAPVGQLADRLAVGEVLAARLHLLGRWVATVDSEIVLDADRRLLRHASGTPGACGTMHVNNGGLYLPSSESTWCGIQCW